MPCFAGGIPITPVISIVPPLHFPQTDVCVNGDGDSININWPTDLHIKMEQMVVHWEAIPTTSEPLILSKISGIDPRITTVLRRVDPSAAGESLTDLVCVIPFYWRVGDTVSITYPNTDDQDVGVEIFLVEVF